MSRGRSFVVCSSQQLASGCQKAVKILDIPKSGRCGDVVFYMRGNKLFRRRYVVPRDPRTAGQLRARVAFGAASKAWSHSLHLTQEEREGWRKAGAKVQSRRRLGQSGPLTGQQHFVGRKCAQRQPGREESNRGCDRKGEGKRASLQTFQSHRVARSTWEHHRSASGVPPGCHAGSAVWPWGVRGPKHPTSRFEHRKTGQSHPPHPQATCARHEDVAWPVPTPRTRSPLSRGARLRPEDRVRPAPNHTKKGPTMGWNGSCVQGDFSVCCIQRCRMDRAF